LHTFPLESHISQGEPPGYPVLNGKNPHSKMVP